ncbi:universal stress protein [Haematospirillum jordaniae]|uniref:UspA domain-containing protein n=1 Tax=Haematospirillum jordaniae TaxID=1549855 RepID=A0A143DCK7_9PROT|nr:universal stress protein [Haematospirillum jordaniae]AMW34003.1 hypothetical protein AY555_01105 [Haematospirillum jordaniae]NKD44344.1 universal stress protein [Haematospirillum jordaniae]NKD57364.1 universal stress protein [Haematospirillum jordaniae]NKD59938.1 universal stress protein [Haematospirillum jordaniae]NKD67805.1 universal stress protein [Haematospirillum jordaniae]
MASFLALMKRLMGIKRPPPLASNPTSALPACTIRGENGLRGFLVLIDETPEIQAVIRYVAWRAYNEAARITLLSVAPSSEQTDWIFVGSRIRYDSVQQAEERLQRAAAEIHRISGVFSQLILREGDTLQEVLSVLDEYRDITIMVTASRPHGEGMAPLIQAVTATSLPVPVTIIPGFLTPVDIDALC